MTDDAELLAGSDADSFAEFYRRHARRLAGWLMRMTGDAEVAADLTAETFAAALVGRASYDPERGAPATWLYGIAAHKLSDWRRRGSAEDRARVRLRMERIELSAEDVSEFERLGSEVSLVELLDGVERRRVEPFPGPSGVDGDFYLVPTPPEWEGGRVSWLDENGVEGSRGHELLPR